MQEAGIVNVFRTILIIVAIYYGLKIIGKYVMPFLLKRFVNNIQKKAQQQQGYKEPQNNVKVGETVIDKKPVSNKQSKDDVGEYVDYEEVD